MGARERSPLLRLFPRRSDAVTKAGKSWTLSESPRAALPQPQTGGFDTRDSFSCRSEVQRSKIKVSAVFF